MSFKKDRLSSSVKESIGGGNFKYEDPSGADAEATVDAFAHVPDAVVPGGADRVSG